MAPRTVKPKHAPDAPAVADPMTEMNLRVLRKDDAEIQTIVAQSKHAVLYGFDPTTRAWARQNVEGALFVVKRASAPRDAFVVLNRSGTGNLTQAIGGDAFELERSPPYLMYRVGSDVRGIWFHDQSECESMSETFERVIREAESGASGDGTTGGDASSSSAANESLRALFASASVGGAMGGKTASDASTTTLARQGSGANGVPRVLQPPRNIVGTSATAPRTKSSIKSSPPTPPTTKPSASTPAAITPEAVRAAMRELIEDDAFVRTIANAISRHST